MIIKKLSDISFQATVPIFKEYLMKPYPYLLFFSLFLSACTQAEPKPSGSVPVSVRSVNYNADRGVTFSLYEITKIGRASCRERV